MLFLIELRQSLSPSHFPHAVQPQRDWRAVKAFLGGASGTSRARYYGIAIGFPQAAGWTMQCESCGNPPQIFSKQRFDIQQGGGILSEWPPVGLAADTSPKPFFAPLAAGFRSRRCSPTSRFSPFAPLSR